MDILLADFPAEAYAIPGVALVWLITMTFVSDRLLYAAYTLILAAMLHSVPVLYPSVPLCAPSCGYPTSWAFLAPPLAMFTWLINLPVMALYKMARPAPPKRAS